MTLPCEQRARDAGLVTMIAANEYRVRAGPETVSHEGLMPDQGSPLDFFSRHGIETSMTGSFRLNLLKRHALSLPRAETPTHWITLGLSRQDAYALASIAADFEISQVVNGVKGVHAMIPKAIFQDSRATTRSVPAKEGRRLSEQHAVGARECFEHAVIIARRHHAEFRGQMSVASHLSLVPRLALRGRIPQGQEIVGMSRHRTAIVEIRCQSDPHSP